MIKVTFILLCVWTCAFAAEEQMQLNVRASKQIYKMGEPLSIEFVLKNLTDSDQSVRIIYPVDPEVTFEFVDKSFSKKKSLDADVEDLSETTIIKARSTLILVYHVNRWFDFGLYSGKVKLKYCCHWIFSAYNIADYFPGTNKHPKVEKNASKSGFTGELEFNIDSQKFNLDDCKSLYLNWNGLSEQQSRETISALLCLNFLELSETLALLARDKPFVAIDVIRGLEVTRDNKWLEVLGQPFEKQEVVINSIRQSKEAVFSGQILSHIIAAFVRARKEPSDAFLSAQLRSATNERILITLKYLASKKTVPATLKEDILSVIDGKDNFNSDLAKSIIAKMKDADVKEKY